MKIFEITEAKVEMCPEACCGKPVTECKCGPDCKHCDCHAKNKAGVSETASAGSTSAGAVAAVANPKAANTKQKKNKDGTAKNAQDQPGGNLMGGGAVKR